MDNLIQRYQRLRARQRAERDQRYAALDAETFEGRVRRAQAEGMDEVTVDDFSRAPERLRPQRQPDPGRADRLRVLFERVQREVSILTLRNVYDKARKLVKNEPAFADLRPKPPTQDETREWLSDKPAFQAAFPVNDWPCLLYTSPSPRDS